MSFTKNFDKSWISNEITHECVNFAEKFGRHLCDLQDNGRVGYGALTTSQIRIFFGEVKRIQMRGFEEDKAAFLLMRPKLAYAEARVLSKNRRSKIADFRAVIEKALSAVQSSDDYKRFVDFVTATLAFHKAAGGKDS